MNLSFLGAAGEVTGSCYLVDTGTIKFLIDCGMFQGGGSAERKNRRFDFKPKDISFVLLSHAHIDHSGLLPRLAAQGFDGPVYATPATGELLAVMLPDSAHLRHMGPLPGPSQLRLSVGRPHGRIWRPNLLPHGQC